MKKLLPLLLAVILTASLCSCGGSQKPAEPAQPAVETASGAENNAESEANKEEAPAETPAEAEAPAEAATPAADAAESAEAPATPEAQEADALPDQLTQADEIAKQYSVADLPAEGEYTLFAVRNQGYTVSAEEMGAESSLILQEGGKGSMTTGEEEMDISTWTLENGTVTITMVDESSAQGPLRGGIIELDIYGTGDMLLIYAQDAADTSGYELLTIDEVREQMAAAEEASKTRLGSFLDTLDIESGIHLRYQLRLDAMDAVQEYDVHGKNGVFYSSRTTKVAGIEDTTVTVIKDGKVYNLDSAKKTGRYVTDMPLSVTGENIMLMDSLFSEMKMASQRTDSTEEEREAEGASYSADVYPETEYRPEIVFFYGDDGQLVYCLKGAPVIETTVSVGESFYTIEAIDGEVDESLFDISAYSIEE